MPVFTNNKDLKKELRLYQIKNDLSIKKVCQRMGIITQRYQGIVRKKNLSFVDIKKICDAMDAELYIEIRKKQE